MKTIQGGSPLRGEITVPGDRSIAHRALILNAIAHGVGRVSGLPEGACVTATTRVLRQLGVSIRQRGPGVVDVQGCDLRLTEPQGPLDCGDSGTTLRMMCGVLAGQPFHSVLTGDASLQQRPTDRIIQPLRRMGARFHGPSDTPPIVIDGRRPLRARGHDIPLASAQVKSALLLAGLQAEGTTMVDQPQPSRDHTELMLSAMGVPIHHRVRGHDARVAIEGGTVPSAVDVEIPGDITSAAFLIVAALIVPGSDVVLRNIGLNPTRLGLLMALERMGASFEVTPRPASGGEARGDIRVTHCDLTATRIGASEVPPIIDELPALIVAATAARRETWIAASSELRHKETARIQNTVALLRKMGALIDVRPDGLRIPGGQRLSGATIGAVGDHRIAMAAAVAALTTSDSNHIDDADCHDISYPGFFDDLDTLQGRA